MAYSVSSRLAGCDGYLLDARLSVPDGPVQVRPSVSNDAIKVQHIALLLEYKGHRVLLAGDAFSGDLVDGIKALNGGEPLRIDAFKLPHHGSKKNIFKSLVEAVDCDRWLFSTDGTQFRHPDATALARVISYSTPRNPLLSFNVPSKYNGWWDNPDWKTMYDYRTEYGTEEDGLTLRFDTDDDQPG